jgi:hypothetical protein
MMHDRGQSDSPAVPTKYPNEAGDPSGVGSLPSVMATHVGGFITSRADAPPLTTRH